LMLNTTLCDKVCQWLVTGRWFSPVSSINKTDSHDKTEILLKVALNTITLTLAPSLIIPETFWKQSQQLLWNECYICKNYTYLRSVHVHLYVFSVWPNFIYANLSK
jgi:hypothetical protein